MNYFELIKMHGLGNDFVIIDNRQNLVKIKKKETLKKIGSRNFGIGCDQIVFIERSNDNISDAKVLIFNCDVIYSRSAKLLNFFCS